MAVRFVASLHQKHSFFGGGGLRLKTCDMNLHQTGTCKEIEDLAQFKNLSECSDGDDEVSLKLLSVLIAKDFIPLDHIFK